MTAWIRVRGGCWTGWLGLCGGVLGAAVCISWWRAAMAVAAASSWCLT